MRPTYVILEPHPREMFWAAMADLVQLPNKKPTFIITRISVRDNLRGQGYGARILSMILEDADKEEVRLILEPSASGGLTQEELVSWYERHGFIYGAWTMLRKPKL